LSGQEIDLPSMPDGPPATQGGGGSDDPQSRFDPLLMNPLGFAADVEDIPDGNEAHGLAGGGLPEESPRRGRITGELEELRRTAGPAPHAPQPKDTGADRSYLYDEWDTHGRRYLQAWCRVHERPLNGGDPTFIADVRRRHATLARHVRRQFSMINPESWRRQRRERDGGELDLDEVVASVVNRRMGIIDDDHLHIRQVRSKREVAAAFLLDMSASTSSPVVDPDAPPAPVATGPQPDEDGIYPGYWWFDNAQPAPPERRVLDLAKESLALMCDALQVLGDEHAIYGFSGAGRDCVDFYIAKDLHEASSARTWGRLAAMKPRQYTRMGPAIRHATAKLRSHPARTRFLVVLSDGYPQDQDYGPDRNDRGYGIADTAKALEEAERAGVLTFCITVDPAGHDYLRQMCPDDRYLVIDDVNALPGELTKLYRTLVLSRS
jgi:nitric oxide reductase NorD protein